MSLEFTEQRNNLYDCIINEIEKLNEYHRVLTRFSSEDLSMIDKYNNDTDLVGFIYMKSYDIITDKMLRAFINIEHAIDRTYTSILKELKSNKTNYVTYSDKPFFELYKEIDNVLDMVYCRKLYDNELNTDIVNKSFMDCINAADEKIRAFMSNIDEEKNISAYKFEELADKCYKLVKNFFIVMKARIESRPYYDKTSIIMKHVFNIATIISNVITTVKIY